MKKTKVDGEEKLHRGQEFKPNIGWMFASWQKSRWRCSTFKDKMFWKQNVGLSLCHANAHFKLKKNKTHATVTYVSNKSISIQYSCIYHLQSVYNFFPISKCNMILIINEMSFIKPFY